MSHLKNIPGFLVKITKPAITAWYRSMTGTYLTVINSTTHHDLYYIVKDTEENLIALEDAGLDVFIDDFYDGTLPIDINDVEIMNSDIELSLTPQQEFEQFILNGGFAPPKVEQMPESEDPQKALERLILSKNNAPKLVLEPETPVAEPNETASVSDEDAQKKKLMELLGHVESPKKKLVEVTFEKEDAFYEIARGFVFEVIDDPNGRSYALTNSEYNKNIFLDNPNDFSYPGSLVHRLSLENKNTNDRLYIRKSHAKDANPDNQEATSLLSDTLFGF